MESLTSYKRRVPVKQFSFDLGNALISSSVSPSKINRKNSDKRLMVPVQNLASTFNHRTEDRNLIATPSTPGNIQIDSDLFNDSIELFMLDKLPWMGNKNKKSKNYSNVRRNRDYSHQLEPERADSPSFRVRSKSTRKDKPKAFPALGKNVRTQHFVFDPLTKRNSNCSMAVVEKTKAQALRFSKFSPRKLY